MAHAIHNVPSAFLHWKRQTAQTPHPSTPADPRRWCDHPLYEYKMFKGSTFVRKRFCAGIRFATMAFPSEHQTVAVVWTCNDEAHVYDVTGSDAFLFSHTIQRQHDPFQTWMQHLGGKEAVEHEHLWSRNDASWRTRSAEHLFRDHIVPFFGRHALARDPSSMRNVRNDHLMWDIICHVSECMEIPARFIWRHAV